MAMNLSSLGFAVLSLFMGCAIAVPNVTVTQRDVEFLPWLVDIFGEPLYRLGTEVVSHVAYDPKTRTIMAVGDEFITILRLEKNLTMTNLHRERFNELDFHQVRFCGRYWIVVAEDTSYDLSGELFIFKRFNPKVGYLQIVRTIPIDNHASDILVSKNCKRMLVATIGETYESDPEDIDVNPVGEVVQIDFQSANLKRSKFRVNRMDFCDYNNRVAELEAQNLFYFNRNHSLCADLEPESMCWNEKETRAFVTLQKNNAIGEISCPGRNKKCEIVNLRGLGFKDRGMAGMGLDPSDEDDVINIQPWPGVKSLYQPDAIECLNIKGKEYLVTANEGIFPSSSNYYRVNDGDVTLDPTAFPNAADLKMDAMLGRLKIFRDLGDMDGDGDYDMLFIAGGRSCALWNADTNLSLIYDSGDAFEQLVAMRRPEVFNADTNPYEDVEDALEDESDQHGPEPESLAFLCVCDGDFWLKFTGAENPGFIFLSILDASNPEAGFTLIDIIDGLPNVIDVTRSWNSLYQDFLVSLLEPEGLTIVEGKDSPTGNPLLLAAAENSNTVHVFEIEVECE